MCPRPSGAFHAKVDLRMMKKWPFCHPPDYREVNVSDVFTNSSIMHCGTGADEFASKQDGILCTTKSLTDFDGFVRYRRELCPKQRLQGSLGSERGDSIFFKEIARSKTENHINARRGDSFRTRQT